MRVHTQSKEERGCIQVIGGWYPIKGQNQTFQGKIWEKFFEEKMLRNFFSEKEVQGVRLDGTRF
jgi:hypothetical protein